MGKHLVVLIHGLWGNFKHMNSLKRMFKKKLNAVDGGNDDYVYFSPMQNTTFKTLDGIEIIGYRALIEICQYIKYYNEKQASSVDDHITKISVLGYSLGGLVARFVIGKMFTDCSDLFDKIEPHVFMTMATPHVGIAFYSKSQLIALAKPVLVLLGSTLLGRSGRELFINDNNQLLVKLTEGEYIEALSRFKYRLLFANVKNDRTVAFYTAFISDTDPFINTSNSIEFQFEDSFPPINFKDKHVPNVIKLNDLDETNLHKRKLAPDRHIRNHISFMLRIFLAFTVFLPIMILLNTGATIYRYWITRKYRKIIESGIVSKHVQAQIGLDDKIRSYIGTTYESMLIDNDDDKETSEEQGETADTLLDSKHEDLKNVTWENFINEYSTSWRIKKIEEEPSYLKSFKALPVDKKRLTIITNLNKLSWIKIPVYIKALNSHGSIVARSTLENTSRDGYATVELAGELVNYLMKN